MFVRRTRRTLPNLRACLRVPSRNGMRSTVGPGTTLVPARGESTTENVAQRIEPFAVNEGDTGSNPVVHPNFVCLTLHFGDHMGGAHCPWDYRDSRRLDPVAGVQSQTFDPLSDSAA